MAPPRSRWRKSSPACAEAHWRRLWRLLRGILARRERLQSAVARLVPVEGLPGLEATAVASMLAGVLVGLLIADSALPAEELDLPVAPLE